MKFIIDIFKSKPELYVGIPTAIALVALKSVNDLYSLIEIGATIIFIIFITDLIKSLACSRKILGPDWLYTGKSPAFPFSSLHKVERSVSKSALVIIVTPNLELDTSDKTIIATVDYNLSKKVIVTGNNFHNDLLRMA